MEKARRKAILFGADFVNLATVRFTPDLLRCVPGDLARAHQALPVSKTQRFLAIAIADPADLDVLDALAKALGEEIEWRVADEVQLHTFIELLYGSDSVAG